MRPAYLRRARRSDRDANRLRPIDLFAMCIGYALLIGMMLFGLVTIGVAVDDWANGRTVDVLAQLSTLLARLD